MDVERKSSSSPDKISQGGRKHFRAELARVRKPGVPQQESDQVTSQISAKRKAANHQPTRAEIERQKELERQERVKAQQERTRQRDIEELDRLATSQGQNNLNEYEALEVSLKIGWLRVKLAETSSDLKHAFAGVDNIYRGLSDEGKEDLLSYIEATASDPNHLEDHRPLGVKIRDSVIPTDQWKKIQSDIKRVID